MRIINKIKQKPILIIFLVSVFSFALPRIYAILIGESYEVLTYICSAQLHSYYTLLWIILIIMIMIPLIKKYPFTFLLLPFLLIMFFNLSNLSFLFSEEFVIFDYNKQSYVAKLGVQSPSRWHSVEIFEFDGKHKSKKPFVAGMLRGNFDRDAPFNFRAPRCYKNDDNSSVVVDCSYYGIQAVDDKH